MLDPILAFGVVVSEVNERNDNDPFYDFHVIIFPTIANVTRATPGSKLNSASINDSKISPIPTDRIKMLNKSFFILVERDLIVNTTRQPPPARTCGVGLRRRCRFG